MWYKRVVYFTSDPHCLYWKKHLTGEREQRQGETTAITLKVN